MDVSLPHGAVAWAGPVHLGGGAHGEDLTANPAQRNTPRGTCVHVELRTWTVDSAACRKVPGGGRCDPTSAASPPQFQLEAGTRCGWPGSGLSLDEVIAGRSTPNNHRRGGRQRHRNRWL